MTPSLINRCLCCDVMMAASPERPRMAEVIKFPEVADKLLAMCFRMLISANTCRQVVEPLLRKPRFGTKIHRCGASFVDTGRK